MTSTSQDIAKPDTTRKPYLAALHTAHKERLARFAAAASTITPKPPKFRPYQPKPIHRRPVWHPIHFPVNPIAVTQKVICEHYGISVMLLLGERRTSDLVRPRHIAMFLAHKITARSLPYLGRRFGGKDHTTIMNAVHNIADAYEKDVAFAVIIDELEAKIKKEIAS